MGCIMSYENFDQEKYNVAITYLLKLLKQSTGKDYSDSEARDWAVISFYNGTVFPNEIAKASAKAGY